MSCPSTLHACGDFYVGQVRRISSLLVCVMRSLLLCVSVAFRLPYIYLSYYVYLVLWLTFSSLERVLYVDIGPDVEHVPV